MSESECKAIVQTPRMNEPAWLSSLGTRRLPAGTALARSAALQQLCFLLASQPSC